MTVMSTIGAATGMKPSDEVIAQGMVSAAKLKAISYCTALLETTTPELRHIFHTHLQNALAEHAQCSKLVIDRGWYKAQAAPQELVAQAVQQAQPVLQ